MSGSGDPIYLGDSGAFDEPKEIFKRLIELIDEEPREGPRSLLDVGCAAGAFLAHAARALDLDPMRTVGLDPGPRLLAEAAGRLPDFEFVQGSIDDPRVLEGRQFDVITVMGVMSLLDDLQPALANILRLLQPGGIALVFDTVNDEPVDVLVRHRRADDPSAEWESSFNVRSRHTYETALARADPSATVDFIPFRMSFAIPKSDDPLRAWTIETAADPHQLVVGTRQLLTSSIVRVRRA